MPDPGGATTPPLVPFAPEGQEQLAPSGPSARLWANVEAVRLVKQLDQAGRPATAEEQQVLARWSGWGAIPQALDPLQTNPFWTTARRELVGLLTPAEWDAAEQNTLNAHYTDLGLVQAMWGGLARLGVTGDEPFTVLEPGCGAGAFIGTAPANARVTGVELDPITARIAGLLYPQATIRTESFARTPLPLPNAGVGVDVVVGNVPFGQYPVYDPVHNKAGHSIHNHFILKGLHALRPGALLMVITSRYTMDARATDAREQMAALADLVGAARLPSTAHKRAAGTETVTDVLILRRRDTDAPPPQRDQGWTNAVPFAGSDTVRVNEYFLAHPEHVLGAMELVDGARYAKADLAVDDAGIAPTADQLGDVLDRIATDAHARGLQLAPRATPPTPAGSARPPRQPPASTSPGRSRSSPTSRTGGTDIAAPAASEGQATPASASKKMHGPRGDPGEASVLALLEQIGPQLPRPDGTILPGADEHGFVVLDRGEQVPHPVPASQATELRGLLQLRDLAVGLLQAEAATTHSTGHEPERVQQLRVGLNTAYDAFVAAHGPIGRWTTRRTGRVTEDGEPVLARQYPKQGGFRTDPYAPVVQALEQVADDGQTATKATIFSRRVVAARPEPSRADDPADAVAICLDRHGEVRLPVIAELLASPDEAQARRALGSLVFDDPVHEDRLVPAAEYLSGPVRDKLTTAREAAEADPDRYEPNVQALEQVIPPDLRPGEIEARLGASWIRPTVVQQFGRELLDDSELRVKHEGGSDWSVRGGRGGVLATSTWGTKRRPAPQLIESLLANRPIRVVDEIEDSEGNTRHVLNPGETAAARDKVAAINARFSEWIWEDPDRAEACAQEYNNTFNNLVLRSYDDAVMSLPGLAETFTARPHQVAAVARIVHEPAVLLAHEVGAGKTAEMVMGAMELRRLGLAAKPAIVVPNHMLEQFSREFLQLYPNARILAMGMEDLQGDKRRRAVARVATGDWDAVILTRGAFERLPVRGTTKDSYMDAEIHHLRDAINEARRRGDDRGVKNAQLTIARAYSRLEQNLDGAKDAGLAFEATGIDYLMVDEAHAYKRLSIRSNDRTLGTPVGSKRAEDLRLKIEYLRVRSTSGRVVTFATATPITNTMAEAYVMQKFLRPDLLERTGTDNFDAWVNTFGQQVTSMELAPDGSGFREKTRLAKFHNVPELLRMFHVPADVKTAEDLHLDTPQIAGGKAETVVIPSTDGLDTYMANLADRAETVRAKSVDERTDNILKIASDGRKAALDLRLVEEDQTEPSKAATVANRVAQIYHEHRDDVYLDPGTNEEHPTRGSLQILFLDLSTPKPHGEWSVYEDITQRLVDHGVPCDQIRWVQNHRKDREKAELFRDCRHGKVAVLMGSSDTMGVGTNVQTRAVALHHVDCHWLPAMIAQREGRILRQGNQHPEVQILQYVTEGSFDGFMWQTCERKARFIHQVLRGRLDQREIEDIGEAVLSYAEIKALATGNPLLLDKATVDAELQTLERKARDHQRTQQSLQRSIEEATRQISELDTQLTTIAQAINRRRDTRGESFTMTLDGTTYTDRSNAGAALRSALAPLVTSWGTDRVFLGHLGGLTLTAYRRVTAKGRQAEIQLDTLSVGTTTYSRTDLEDNSSPHSLITRIENKIAGLDKSVTKLQDRRERHLAEKTKAESEHPKPFSDAEALSAARRRVHEIDDQLAQEQGNLPTHQDDPPVPGPDDKPATRHAATDRGGPSNTSGLPTDHPIHEPAGTSSSPNTGHAPSPDEGPPEATPPGAAGDGEPRIRITRNARGYIVTGTERGDRDLHQALRDARFRFSRSNGGFWYLPSHMLPREQERRVQQLTTTLTTLDRPFTGPTPTQTHTDQTSPPHPTHSGPTAHVTASQHGMSI